MMRNIRLLICYDGTRYKGWQRLPGVDNTIQGKLEQVLSKLLDEEIEISGSGRTDAGAHAMG
jgi:tRNA pseudouridine38-40 synthase